MMTSTQVVKASVITTDNSPSQDYIHPDNQTSTMNINTNTNKRVDSFSKKKE